jgi:PAS domain S-box-containing protein
MYPFPSLAQLLAEPRIAALVADAAPALLFDSDGRLRFANRAAIRAHDATTFLELAERASELFGELPALARELSGSLALNGAPLRRNVATNAGDEVFRCERIALANGSAVLFSGEARGRAEGGALEALTPLLDSERAPIAAFDLEGRPLHLNRMAATIMGPAGTLHDFHPDASRAIAEATGKGSADIPFGVLRLLLKRIDFGDGRVLIASFSQPERAAPAPMPTATPLPPVPELVSAPPPVQREAAAPAPNELPEVIVLGPPTDAPDAKKDPAVPDVIALGPPPGRPADTGENSAETRVPPSPFAVIVEEAISIVFGKPAPDAATAKAAPQADAAPVALPETKPEAAAESDAEIVPAPLMADAPDIDEIVRGNASGNATRTDAFVPEQPVADFIAADADEEIAATEATPAPAPAEVPDADQPAMAGPELRSGDDDGKKDQDKEEEEEEEEDEDEKEKEDDEENEDTDKDDEEDDDDDDEDEEVPENAAPREPVTAENGIEPPAMVAPERSEKTNAADPETVAAPVAPQIAQTAKPPRRSPTRFVWQSGADGRFTSVSADLADAVGAPHAAQSGEDWAALGARAGIERIAGVVAAMKRRDTWSGVSVLWPVAGAATARPVELAALPVFDRDRNFAGFRGFGVFRDPVPFIARTRPEPLAEPEDTDSEPQNLSAARSAAAFAEPLTPATPPPAPNVVSLRPAESTNEAPRPALTTTEQSAFQEIGRVLGKQAPSERDVALHELSRALGLEPPEERNGAPAAVAANEAPAIEREADVAPTAQQAFAPRPRPGGDEDDERDDDEDDGDDGDDKPQTPDAPSPEIEEPEEEDAPDTDEPPEDDAPEQDEPPEQDAPVREEPPSDQPPVEAPRQERVADPAPETPFAASLRAIAPAAIAVAPASAPAFEPEPAPAPKPLPPGERALLDRLPLGVAVHRNGRVLYANRTLLDWLGLGSMDELDSEGGLARIFSAATLAESERNADTPRTLAARGPNGEPIPVETRLISTPWYGESALVYVLRRANAGFDERREAIERALRAAEASSREHQAILDTATDGVLLIDHDGRLLGMNKSAEALFGFDFAEVKDNSFTMLFAPESHRAAVDYLDGLATNGVASVLNDGREVVGRERQGGLIPLFMTLGKVGDGGQKFCAVLRDITQWKRAEEELTGARRQAEIASSHKSDFLAKISHEMRTPLNAIIGFAEVMIEERFGPVGSERYREYLKDIHHSGGHLISLINDLLDLSKIEAGKLELNFTSVDINDIAQQCMSIMQPQANRERIIIRSALASPLPPVVADARSIRQIVLNLLSNSVKFTRPGGQVILSTTLTESGEVCLRVRDTGVGMTGDEVLAALEPFRQLATAGSSSSRGTGLGLPLTKALVEANRAAFTIKSAPNAGTLIEVAFPSTRVLAG